MSDIETEPEVGKIEVEFKGTVEALRLEPGDKLVVKLEAATNPMLFQQLAEAIRPALNELFPSHKIIFMGPGMSLDVVRASELEVPDFMLGER